MRISIYRKATAAFQRSGISSLQPCTLIPLANKHDRDQTAAQLRLRLFTEVVFNVKVDAGLSHEYNKRRRIKIEVVSFDKAMVYQHLLGCDSPKHKAVMTAAITSDVVGRREESADSVVAMSQS